MEIELTIDGNEIVMNNFVKRIIAGIMAGAAESLDGVEKDWKDLQLIMKR